jgi:hypothetical protein
MTGGGDVINNRGVIKEKCATPKTQTFLVTQAAHSGSIIGGIMHFRSTKMMMWHIIKEGR